MCFFNIIPVIASRLFIEKLVMRMKNDCLARHFICHQRWKSSNTSYVYQSNLTLTTRSRITKLKQFPSQLCHVTAPLYLVTSVLFTEVDQSPALYGRVTLGSFTLLENFN
ncbi:hypothetical protein RF11_03794 [Thelohanellus kitauei]|uniref:Uncharacterized protein n=1 Tax=Thelohanellus kitauei TaxID=669202 RepID=A0A0C2ITZ1_THEKT|nr:hypothetical protein RF11_03794 [Thelohanellus kitauei]